MTQNHSFFRPKHTHTQPDLRLTHISSIHLYGTSNHILFTLRDNNHNQLTMAHRLHIKTHIHLCWNDREIWIHEQNMKATYCNVERNVMVKSSITKSERAQLLWDKCLLSSMKIIQQHCINVWLLSYKEEGDLRSVCNMTHKAVTNNLLAVKLDKLGQMHLQRNQRRRLYSGLYSVHTVESFTNKPS